jgi:hypothetical protein
MEESIVSSPPIHAPWPEASRASARLRVPVEHVDRQSHPEKRYQVGAAGGGEKERRNGGDAGGEPD